MTDKDFDLGNISVKLNDSLKYSWRIGCFVSDPYEALVTKTREDRGEDIISAIYERGHSRPRMWAQYGENYSGACLVFDRAKLDAAIRTDSKTVGCTVHAGKVEYRNPTVVPDLSKPNALTIHLDEIRRLGLNAAVEAHVSRHMKDLFFLKARDWEQEREYRWIVSGQNNEDLYINIESALIGIALGDRFPDDIKRKVGLYAESRPVHIAVMNWQNGVPQPAPSHWRLLLQST